MLINSLFSKYKGGAFKMLRTDAGIGAPWPFGHAGGVAVSVVSCMSLMLDKITIVS